MGKKKKDNAVVVDPATRKANVLDELKFIRKNKKIEKAKVKVKDEENSSEDDNRAQKLPPFFKAVQEKTKAKVKEVMKEKEEKGEV